MNQWTLGELIDALERETADNLIRFDFAGCTPTSLDSYRGYYEQLAVGFCDDSPYPRVGDFLAILKSAVGSAFYGWKGGEYFMVRDTPLWVANPGKTGGTAIVGLHECSYMTVIKTAWVDS